MKKITKTIPAVLIASSVALFAACSTTTPTPKLPSALEQTVTSRSADDQARDGARHPVQTLEFFDVQPGMTVAEALPGGGWYTNILARYLGDKGTIYGVNYPDEIWPMFSFATEKLIKERIASTAAFPSMVAKFEPNGPQAIGFTFAQIPQGIEGTVDRVLLIRALHNLNRFEAKTGMRSQALTAVHKMLKDDGLVGVVQHRAPATAEDSWADGSRGYLKQDMVIGLFEDAGFELVSSSEINANAKDKPGVDDIVWRLPPSLSGSKEDPAKLAAVLEIGESDRMTLKFRKRQ